MAVRLALGETHVIADTKRQLGEAGGWLRWLRWMPGSFSRTVANVRSLLPVSCGSSRQHGCRQPAARRPVLRPLPPLHPQCCQLSTS